MNRDLHNYRQSYEAGALDMTHTEAHPMDQFANWFKEVEKAGGVKEPNAMSLATLGEDDYPKVRIVLLKEYSRDGFVFYTNYESEKGRSIAKHPEVGLSFFWPNLERQVIIKGTTQKVSDGQSDTYFASRPKDSQLGALVSDQSSIIQDRSVLEEKMEVLAQKYKEKDIERPKHWGGYRVVPESIEFWQGRPNRLHDRIRYTWIDAQWIKERLAP